MFAGFELSYPYRQSKPTKAEYEEALKIVVRQLKAELGWEVDGWIDEEKGEGVGDKKGGDTDGHISNSSE